MAESAHPLFYKFFDVYFEAYTSNFEQTPLLIDDKQINGTIAPSASRLWHSITGGTFMYEWEQEQVYTDTLKRFDVLCQKIKQTAPPALQTDWQTAILLVHQFLLWLKDGSYRNNVFQRVFELHMQKLSEPPQAQVIFDRVFVCTPDSPLFVQYGPFTTSQLGNYHLKEEKPMSPEEIAQRCVAALCEGPSVCTVASPNAFAREFVNRLSQRRMWPAADVLQKAQQVLYDRAQLMDTMLAIRTPIGQDDYSEGCHTYRCALKREHVNWTSRFLAALTCPDIDGSVLDAFAKADLLNHTKE